MNELLDQFVVECRELAEQASADLLALERAPEAADRLDSLFRCFHTLKGAGGIVAFPAMGQLMHAAEDVLAEMRAGRRKVTPDIVGACLACLDQVVDWLDQTERSGQVPDVPEVRSLLDALGNVASAPPPAPDDEAIWVAALAARHPSVDGARTAFRLVPTEDCFLRNVDPLAVVAALPGLLVLEVAPARPWPPPQDLDPFACNLVITGLTAAAPDVVAPLLRGIDGERTLAAVRSGLPLPAAALLQEQLGLVLSADAAAFAGTVGAAGRVAAGVLRALAMSDAARAVTDAADAAIRTSDAQALVDLLRGLLPPPSAPVEAAAPAMRASRTLRIDADRIDVLAGLAGQLVVASNALGHLVRQNGDRAWKDQHAVLERLVTALRRAVQDMRVLPMAHTFQSFPRLVREMARDLGKPAELVIEGETTEADKTVVEALFEPLLHLLRNALDHGVEPPSERNLAGKPAVATILLRARRSADQVIIEIADDGGGIDTDAIRRVAIARGLVSVVSAAEMADHAVTQLIFAPGFSTAATVTGLSGRGVGMDAVRAALARLGGSVVVRSTRGEGTTVTLTVPYSVMLLGVMTVEAGGQAFGIPLDAIVETARLARETIHGVGAAHAVVLRGRTVPLLRLAGLLGLAQDGPPAPQARIVVISAAGQLGAVEVERLGDRVDLMVKPLDGLLAGTRGFAGTAVLGDGRVLLVLDPAALFA